MPTACSETTALWLRSWQLIRSRATTARSGCPVPSEFGGGNVIVADEPLFAGSNGALQLAMDMPSEYWQQLS